MGLLEKAHKGVSGMTLDEIAQGWAELDDNIDGIAMAELGLTKEQVDKIKEKGHDTRGND